MNRRAGVLAVGCVACFLPLGYSLSRGLLTSPLWLDEVAYHYWEEDLAARAREIGRPDSIATRLLTNYAYGYLQALARHALEAVGVSFREHPEIVLRALPLAAFAGSVLLVGGATLRRTRSAARAGLAALLIASAPLFLHYALEARGYFVACFAALVLVVLLEPALPERAEGPAVAVPAARLGGLALASLFLAQAHQWTACLLAGLFAVGAVRRLDRRAERSEALAWAAASLPGLAAAAMQFLYLRATDPESPRFPLLEPRPPAALLGQMLPALSDLHGFLPSAQVGPARAAGLVAGGLVFVAVALALVELRRHRAGWLLLAAALGLALSALVAVSWGNLIPVRHQVFLYAALLYPLARSAHRATLAVLGLAIALHLAVLPVALTKAALRSNGPTVAAQYRAHGGSGEPIVVQHPTRLGYPDPVLSFPADFYLNVVGPPSAPPVPLLELPALRDVAGLRVLSPVYFWGGPELLARYRSVPTAAWRAWLAAEAPPRLWFLAPVPAIRAEAAVAVAFGAALGEAGYRAAAGTALVLEGNPPSVFTRFERPEAEASRSGAEDPGSLPRAPSERAAR